MPIVDSDITEADAATIRLKAMLNAFTSTIQNMQSHLETFAPLVALIPEEDRLPRVMAVIARVFAIDKQLIDPEIILGRLHAHLNAIQAQMLNQLFERPETIDDLFREQVMCLLLALLLIEAGATPDFNQTWAGYLCAA